MKQGSILTVLLLFATLLHSQNSTSLFYDCADFNPSHNRKLFFRLENIDFLKNNEYEGDIATGYTLLGGWLRPKLVYYASDKVRFEVGGHFLRYHGRENFENSSFVFRTYYQPTKELAIIFGNINNNENHRLIRPLFEPEKYLTEKPEGGIQFLLKNRWLDADMWLNWEQFILHDDPFQEHFTFGLRSDIQLWSSKFSRISVPLQLVATHKGGQIDTSPQPVQTIMNSALGISFTKDLASHRFKQWGCTASFVGFKDNSGTKQYVYGSGSGIYLDGFVDTRIGKFSGNYWNAEKFIAPRGMELYQSISSKVDGYYTPGREIASFNYSYSKEVIQGATFSTMLQLHYDFGPNKLSNVLGFFFAFNESFFMKEL